MESLRIKSPKKGTRVQITGGTPPQPQSFLPKWMTGSSANSSPQRASLNGNTRASRDANRGVAPRSHPPGPSECPGCITPGARHNQAICAKSTNGGGITSAGTRFRQRNGSTSSMNLLEGPTSRRTQALLNQSVQAISDSPCIGPLGFEKNRNTKTEGYGRATRLPSTQDSGNIDRPAGMDFVSERSEDGSLINVSIQDRIFPLEWIEAPADESPPENAETLESRSRQKFSPTVDRISESSVASDRSFPLQGKKSAREELTSDNYWRHRSSIKSFGEYPRFHNPLTFTTINGASAPPNSPNSYSEPLDFCQSSSTVTVKDVDARDIALPSPAYPQLSTLQPSEHGNTVNPLSGLSLAEPIIGSPLPEDVDQFLKNKSGPRLAPVDSYLSDGEPPASLLLERPSTSLPNLGPYQVEQSETLSASIYDDLDDSDDEGAYSMPGSFVVASRARIREELSRLRSNTRNSPFHSNQSFEDIDEVMATAESPLQGTPQTSHVISYSSSPLNFLPDFFAERSMRNNPISAIYQGAIDIPSRRTRIEDSTSSWGTPAFAISPQIPGSWPTTPSPSPPPSSRPTTQAPRRTSSSISEDWQERPLDSPGSSLHLRGGGGNPSLFRMTKYVPDVENGKKLLDQKINGLESFLALGMGKGKTYREFGAEMKKRTERVQEIKKEKLEMAEAARLEKLAKDIAELTRKSEAGEGTMAGVMNKVKGVLGKKAKKGGEPKPEPDVAAAGVGGVGVDV